MVKLGKIGENQKMNDKDKDIYFNILIASN